jgi:hypothetical protein
VKIIIGIGGSGMLLGSLYASDALTAGRVYDIPLQQAYSELSTMPVPDPLLQATTANGATSVAIRRSAEAIDWQFEVRGRNVATFTVRLSAESADRTRVRIEYTPGEPLSPELGHLTSAALIRDLARIAMSEQVEAQLEHRPFDQNEIVDALARHAASHPEQVREYGVAVGEMLVGMRRQIDENSRGLSTAGADEIQPSLPPGFDQPPVDAAAWR